MTSNDKTKMQFIAVLRSGHFTRNTNYIGALKTKRAHKHTSKIMMPLCQFYVPLPLPLQILAGAGLERLFLWLP